jgi:type I restriction-modification system DNA methylase subunit
VRLIKPELKHDIYDPCCGSGGMLIAAKEYIDEHGEDGRKANLFGQEFNGTVWSIAKMNMLLHGISTANLQNDDTLAEPQHVEGGELMRFDRVLTNPPFSINWGNTEKNANGTPAWAPKFPERFSFGQVPLGAKKADLMFLQHMLAVTRNGGMIATVMPHGVLFRGGEEKTIRAGFIDADLLEAVIGVAPNLFYGTGIPACILVLRQPLVTGKVIFGRFTWIKDPDTGRRRYRERPQADWLVRFDESLRIVSDAAWDAVVARNTEIWNRRGRATSLAIYAALERKKAASEDRGRLCCADCGSTRLVSRHI